LGEIKAAGLGVAFARSIGISVDHRRKNRTQESLDLNKNRLTNYLSKLVLFPRNAKKPVTKAKHGIVNDSAKESQKVGSAGNVNALPPLIKRVKSVSAADVEKLKKTNVYRTLKQ
jgi:large subunit ribosomal protein L13e